MKTSELTLTSVSNVLSRDKISTDSFNLILDLLSSDWVTSYLYPCIVNTSWVVYKPTKISSKLAELTDDSFFAVTHDNLPDSTSDVFDVITFAHFLEYLFPPSCENGCNVIDFLYRAMLAKEAVAPDFEGSVVEFLTALCPADEFETLLSEF